MAWCKGCGAKIEWWKTVAGKNMPVDSDPHPEGNVQIDVAANIVRVVPVGSHKPLYRSHFVTCEKAGDFRRPKPKAFVCGRAGCGVDGSHLHCFECGAVDHIAEDCPDGR
jgi:hypothetical protein